jgi:hypothetical protein
MIGHQVYLNAASCLSKYGQFGCPSEFMNVTMWEHHTYDNKIFGCGKVYFSNSFIITNLVQKGRAK